MELDRSGSALDIQELLSVRERIDKLLANQHEEAQPRADLLDTGDSYRLIMEVPGLKEENLEIALDGQRSEERRVGKECGTGRWSVSLGKREPGRKGGVPGRR